MDTRAEMVALFLTQGGQNVPAQRVRELTGELDRDGILRLFKQKGMRMRCVEPSVDALAKLPVPSLVELADGALHILEEVRGGTALVRGADDQVRTMPLTALSERLACAFERLPTFEGAQDFLKALRARLFAQRRDLVLLGATVLGLVGLNLLTPTLTRKAMSEALDDRSYSLLWTLVTGIFACAILHGWLGWLQARARITIDARLLRLMVPLVFKRLLALPYAQQQKRGFAEQIAALTSSEEAARGVTGLILSPAIEGVTLLFYLVTLFVFFPIIGSVTGAGALLTVAVAYVLSRWRARAESEAVREGSEARARLHDLIQGIATVKSEHAEQPVLLRWFDALLRERGLCLERELREGWIALWLCFVERGLRLFVMAYGTFEVLEGRMLLPDFIYVGMLNEGVIKTVGSISSLLGEATAVGVHTERVDALLKLGDPSAETRSTVAADAAQPVVVLRDVWFRHGPDLPWILKGHDLTVQRGEHHMLRGASGTGKSTILRLIAGIYRPERGTVLVCGADPACDRSHVRYLPQRSQLFAGSIRDNLEILSGAQLDAVMEAAQRTGIIRWLATLPMGIETVVAPQGANLSGGQRQWLLLTAAVASTQPVVVLDESMSAIDHVVRSTLRVPDLFGDRTTVGVAHD